MKKINKGIIVLIFLILLLVTTSTLACSGYDGWRRRHHFRHRRRCHFRCEKPEPEPQCIDSDQDGYYAYDGTACLEGDDCDDSDPEVNPGLSEDPLNENCSDGKDNDCDGLIDMEDPGCEAGIPD